jgi:hypothetical protein
MGIPLSHQKKKARNRADKSKMLVNQAAEKYKLSQSSQTTAERKVAILQAKLQKQTQMVVRLEESNRQLLIEISSLKTQMERISGTESNLRRGIAELEEAFQFANTEVVEVIRVMSPITPVRPSAFPGFR